METLVNILFSIVILIFFTVFALSVWFGFKLFFVQLDDPERIAVYRWGRFWAVRGPGIVLLSKRIHNRIHRFEVHERPLTIPVRGLFVNGVPMMVELSFWAAFDPQKTIGTDRTKLASIFHLTQPEIKGELEVKLRNELMRQIDIVSKPGKLFNSDNIVDKVKPVIPCFPECIELIERLQASLATIIYPLGYRSSDQHPLSITGLDAPASVLKGFDRGRAVEILRRQFPNLPDEIIIQYMAADEGINLFDLQKIIMENNTGRSTIDLRNDTGTRRIRTSFPESTQEPIENLKVSNVNKEPVEEANTVFSFNLTKRDYAPVKRILQR